MFSKFRVRWDERVIHPSRTAKRKLGGASLEQIWKCIDIPKRKKKSFLLASKITILPWKSSCLLPRLSLIFWANIKTSMSARIAKLPNYTGLNGWAIFHKVFTHCIMDEGNHLTEMNLTCHQKEMLPLKVIAQASCLSIVINILWVKKLPWNIIGLRQISD